MRMVSISIATFLISSRPTTTIRLRSSQRREQCDFGSIKSHLYCRRISTEAPWWLRIHSTTSKVQVSILTLNSSPRLCCGSHLIVSNNFPVFSVLTPRRQASQNSPSPDDDVFRHLAQVYSFSHEVMYQGQPCPTDSKGFPNGTTNGAQWYLLEGEYSTASLASCRISPVSLTDYSINRWNARLQLLLDWLYGNHSRIIVLQIPSSPRVASVLGAEQEGSRCVPR